MNQLPLVLIGVDFRRAPTRYRAALALSEPARDELVATLRDHGATGLVVLETCNRTEWLVASERPAWVAQLLEAHMIHCWHEAGFTGTTPKPYHYEGEECARHLFRVASGLESFVLGERQIAGQLQRAFESARAAERSCALLNILGSWSGRVVRKLQRRGAHATPSAGVQLLALEAVHEHLDEGARVGVVGMGEIGQRCAELFRQRGHQVECFNRTPIGPGIHGLDDLTTLAASLDALVLATGAASAWLDVSDLGDQRLLVIDIGSPQQALDNLGQGTTYLDLDALLVGCRPTSQRRVEALEDEVELGVADFRLSQVRRGLRHVVELNHRTYEELAYSSLPQVIAGHEQMDSRQLEARVRGLLRRYSRAVLRAVEDSEDSA